MLAPIIKRFVVTNIPDRDMDVKMQTIENMTFNRDHTLYKKKLEDTKGVSRSRKSKKGRQYNGQKKDRQYNGQKTEGQTIQWPKDRRTDNTMTK